MILLYITARTVFLQKKCFHCRYIYFLIFPLVEFRFIAGYLMFIRDLLHWLTIFHVFSWIVYVFLNFWYCFRTFYILLMSSMNFGICVRYCISVVFYCTFLLKILVNWENWENGANDWKVQWYWSKRPSWLCFNHFYCTSWIFYCRLI